MKCPDCGKKLKLRWHGLLACFCLWGGKEPTPEQINEKCDQDEPDRCAPLHDLETREVQLARFRDCVLNERFQLEGMGLDGDQINAVLSLFDDQFGPVLKTVRQR